MIQIDWKPNSKKLRQFAAVWFVGFSVLAIALHWYSETPSADGSQLIPTSLLALAFLVGVPGFIWPELVRPVYLLWMGLAFPVGWVLSHLFLGLVYYLVFTPVALIFRIIRRDPLQLREGAATDSHWITKDDSAEPKSYFRQF